MALIDKTFSRGRKKVFTDIIGASFYMGLIWLYSYIKLLNNYTIVGIFLLLVFYILGYTQKDRYKIISAIGLCAISSFLIIEVGNCNTFDTFTWSICLLNFITYALLFLLVWGTAGRLSLTIEIYITFFTILGIVAYYVYAFRSVPFMFSYITAATTALTVIQNYKFDITTNILIVLVHCCFCFCFVIRFHRDLTKPMKMSMRIKTEAAVIISLGLCYWTNFLPIRATDWEVQLAYHRNGFLVNTIKGFADFKVTKPESYSEAKMDELEQEIYDSALEKEEFSSIELSEFPDIILIVNESFYDLKKLVDFETDVPVTPFMDKLDNTVRGYAVNPNITTANSEFEILCTTPIRPAKELIPFNSLRLDGVNSVVKSLQELGYHTAGFHPASEKNYNRINVYEELGFDGIYFLKDLDESVEKIRGHVSDSAAYEIVKEIYEENIGAPQLVYCLTIQNHAGYETNEIDYTVNVTNGLENTDEYREYFSLLKKSDEAFKELVEYFSSIEKPVIVCMVGDHPPIMFEKYVKTLDDQVKFMGTPFILWANYPIEETDYGYFGMSYLTNIIKETADLPLTPYEQYFRLISEEIPTIAANFYIDNESNPHLYGEGSKEDRELLDEFLSFQYRNIKGIGNREIYHYK